MWQVLIKTPTYKDFNVVVDAVLHHWIIVLMVSEEVCPLGASSTEGFGREVQRLADYFYTDGGLIALTQATHLHWDYETLTELFDRVVLHTNVAKTVSMECQPCCALGGNLEEVY